MSLVDFKQYLVDKKYEEDKITEAISQLKQFSDFLESIDSDLQNASYDQFYLFAETLIESEENSYQDFLNYYHYSQFSKNKELIIAVMEVLDGAEMFPNFEKQLLEKYGEQVRDEIFEGITLPPLGTHPKEKPAIIKKLVSRFIKKFGSKESVEFFKIGLRNKYPSSYKSPKEKFDELQDLDEFLKYKHQKLVDNLTKHLENDTLFFTQPVNQEVIDFVKNDQEISAGIRKGDKIFMYKIPYMTLDALKEKDKKKRNYFVCHNPLFREALLDEEVPIDPIFCNCSGGYMKNFWEAMFEEEVDVELLDSVVLGGDFCKFAIKIPQKILDNLTKSK